MCLSDSHVDFDSQAFPISSISKTKYNNSLSAKEGFYHFMQHFELIPCLVSPSDELGWVDGRECC